MEIVKTDLDYYDFIEENPEFTGCVIDTNGKRHRTNGPIRFGIGLSWAVNGKNYHEENLRTWKLNAFFYLLSH